MAKKEFNKEWIFPIGFWLIFILFTVAVLTVDVRPIGPNGTGVGFAALNGEFFDLTGYSEFWDDFSEAVGYVAFVFVAFYGLVGLCQWIRRKKFLAVDADILVLGGFYLVVLLLYVTFLFLPITYRPVILDGELKASFPSSHTLMAVSVYGTALLRVVRKRTLAKKCAVPAVVCFSLLMAVAVVSRLLSGLHWLTDVIGGIMLACALIVTYDTVCRVLSQKETVNE